MKKLLFILLFVPFLANGQDLIQIDKGGGTTGAVLLADSGVYNGGYVTPTGLDAAVAAIVTDEDYILAMQGLGSDIIAKPATMYAYGTSGRAFTDGTVYFAAVYIREDATITGVRWAQSAQGDYTANNYNGVGLYSYSGGTLTLVASSADDGNIWKIGAFTESNKAFSSTYAATAGVYFVAALYNSSAEVTPPSLYHGSPMTGVTQSFSLTNSAKLNSSIAAQASLPASQLSSGLATNSYTFGLFLY